MKKLLTILICVSLLLSVGLLSGCGPEENMPEYTEPTSESSTEEANIPTSTSEVATENADSSRYQKKFPAPKEDFEVKVLYKPGTPIALTEADLDTFEYYVESYSAIWANNGSPDYDTSELPYATPQTTEEIIRANEESGDSTILLGCQIFTVTAKEDGTVEIIYLKEMEGYIDFISSEGVFWSVSGMRLNKVDGEWAIVETGKVHFDCKGTFDIRYDEQQEKVVVVLANPE